MNIYFSVFFCVLKTLYGSLPQNTGSPFVWYTTPENNETLSINEVCEQRVGQKDVSSTVSHSKIMDSEDVDLKVEVDDVLSTL